MTKSQVIINRTRKQRAIKRLFLILMISLTFNLILGLTSLFKANALGNPIQEFETLIVKQGDTLWSIASRYQSDEDPRGIIHQILKINNLDQSSIYAGQNLKVPVDN
ncbi:MAG: cell division suppressor protein YneA [Thermincolia bacterium]